MKRFYTTLLVIFLGIPLMAATSHWGEGATFSGGDNIRPRGWWGHTFLETIEDVRDELGGMVFFAGTHTGQFLNSGYGKFIESGKMRSNFGFSGGVLYPKLYPLLLDVEYTYYKDQFGDFSDKDNIFSNRNTSLAAFLSYVPFPWSYKLSTYILPVVGIGIQTGSYKACWKTAYNSGTPIETIANYPINAVIQPLYKLGLLFHFPIEGNYRDTHIWIYGNYYRSLITKDRPHAFSAVSFGIGIGF